MLFAPAQAGIQKKSIMVGATTGLSCRLKCNITTGIHTGNFRGRKTTHITCCQTSKGGSKTGATLSVSTANAFITTNNEGWHIICTRTRLRQLDAEGLERKTGTRCSVAQQGSTSDVNVNFRDGTPTQVEREPHKYFDQVLITVRAGDGGNGAVLKMSRPSTPGKAPGKAGKELAEKRKKDKEKEKEKKYGRRGLKRGPDGNVLLPIGGHGGDVYLVADENVDTLVALHAQRRHTAHRGGNADAQEGLSRAARDGMPAAPLRIPVPVGTVVKKKRGGKLLADLVRPGDEVLVARGGRGGISMLQVPQSNQGHLRPVKAPEGATIMVDPQDKALTKGTGGEEVSLELTLRVVADVGLVGLPNAGKSSLLAAITGAKPEIANYPFTTLMPNLGRMEGDMDSEDGGAAMGATLADLPGLIEGAHMGRGLGKMFLRHLRRTRVLVHVVDAAAPDPLHDYHVLRQELHYYNPQYTQRPHIVVLNKLDLPEAAERWQQLHNLFLAPSAPSPSRSDSRQACINGDDNFITTSETKAQVPEGLQSGYSLSSKEISEVAGSRSGVPRSSTALAVLEEEVDGLSSSSRLNGASTSNNDALIWTPPLAVIGISAKERTGILEVLQVIRQAVQGTNGAPTQETDPGRGALPTQRAKAPQWQV